MFCSSILVAAAVVVVVVVVRVRNRTHRAVANEMVVVVAMAVVLADREHLNLDHDLVHHPIINQTKQTNSFIRFAFVSASLDMYVFFCLCACVLL